MLEAVANLREMWFGIEDSNQVSRSDRLTHQARKGSSLNIGVITAEFPPHHGGMQEHARGLVESLAREHKISVYTSSGFGLETHGRNVTIKPVLRWQMPHDVRKLQREPVDAWITLNAGLAPYSLGLSAPLFAYVHGNDFTRPWHPHITRRMRVARKVWGPGVVESWRMRRIGAGLRAARWIFANSAFSRGLCAEMYGVSEDRFTVVPPGMRPEFFTVTNPGVSTSMRLVTVSRLTTNAERKNIGGVMEAIALLKGEMAVSYTVIGDGDDLPRLRGLAEQLGVASDVRFLGSVGTERVIEEFGRSDAFIMVVKPSEGDVEGFGMVYAEAAATGLPSIGTDTGGIPEVIENGVTGLLLDDVSPGGIAEGLRRFHRQKGDFNRTMIRAKAERFSAPSCSAMIAETIAAMI